MKLFKKNQVIIYVIVLMLMTAGYLNYTTNAEKQASVETAIQMEASDDMQLAGIGDATLVNSNDVVDEDTSNTNDVDNTTNEVNTNQIPEFSNDTSATNTTNIKEENVNQNNTTQTSSNSSNDYFVKSKLERDTMYSQMIETYEKVLNSTNSLETQRQSASQEIQKINEVKNSIMICENLISTKGFENNVVFVNGSSVSVIIGTSSEMKAEEVAQVQNIIAREMKAEIENIHIATK